MTSVSTSKATSNFCKYISICLHMYMESQMTVCGTIVREKLGVTLKFHWITGKY